MKIAVLVGGLRFDSQRRIMDGILAKAAQDKTDVYVFTCDAWTYSTPYYSRGETRIFSLPDFSSYDGVILHGDTVYDKSVINKVIAQIKEAGIPCISLNVKHKGMLHIGMENTGGIYDITTHLIKEHHAGRFAFIAGPEGNSDSTERLAGFKKALKDNGISFDKHYLYYGDYHPEGGRKAVDYFCSLPGDFPDAVVAANDEMALGAFYELKDRGYDVPGDVMLTGYDHAFSGRNHFPQITSVERPEIELGSRAYEKLRDYINGNRRTQEELLRSMPVYGGSCGCADHIAESEEEFRQTIIRDRVHITSYSEIVKSSSADFTGAPTFEQLLAEIRRYIKMMDPEEFYMCMCVVKDNSAADNGLRFVDIEPEKELTEYAPYICAPIAYRRGSFESYGRFEVEKLLPEVFAEGEGGRFYTVIPLHYQERCYGYCVLCNSRLMMESELFHLFIMNINNALENLRKQAMLNSMVQRLNRMWVYDTLTGVFNRAGFFRYAPTIIREANEKHNDLFILFLDLDGLKSVNDKYGHDEGDHFIRTMGEILTKLHRHGELLMRYGGDEFVMLAQGYTKEDAENYIQKIQMEIENYNVLSDKPYRLDASIGYNIVEPCENPDIEELIESADREMYKVKNEKKRQKGFVLQETAMRYLCS